MTATQPRPDIAKVIRLIHIALTMGVALMAGVMIVMRSTGAGAAPSGTAMQGYLIAGMGVMAIAVGLAVLRPRVPARGSTESPEEYWTEMRRAAAIVVWALIEAGGLMGVVGFMLTGLWTPLAVTAISLAGLFLTRPASFEG